MQKKPTKYFMSDGTPMKNKCNEEGLCYYSVLKHVERGMSPDDAFERAKITKNDPSKYLGTLRYGDESLSRYCRRNGINYNRVYTRVTNRSMSIEEALSLEK